MASPKEGFFETNPAMTIGANLTGTLDALAAGVTAVVGALTDFDPEVVVGNILSFLDTAGERQFYTVKTVTDDNNIVLSQPTRSVSPILTDFQIATQNTNYLIVRDAQNPTFPLADPILGKIGAGSAAGYRMNAPSISGANLIDSIDPNEGIRINTLYIRNPFQHTWADRSFMLTWFRVVNAGGAQSVITQLGVNGLTFQPMENVEVPVNIYVPPLSTRWGLAVQISNSYNNQNSSHADIVVDQLQARMSNVNVPASMDGMLLPIVIGCRFTYGLTITAA